MASKTHDGARGTPGGSGASEAGFPAELLLEKTAISLRSAVPAAGFHAGGVPRATMGDAGRYGRPIGALVAAGNAGLLFAVATHGSRHCGARAEQDCCRQDGHRQHGADELEDDVPRIDERLHDELLGAPKAPFN